ncbi:MAG: flagellar basal body L-ring protein FlgH [Candidatus Riflebacteria bacterium]|nr:flagellar basal body L-ring protein FlgH [Candidatus Riflebacteria bacterium]
MRKNKISFVLLICLGLSCLPSSQVSAASLWLNGNDLYSSQGAARNYKPGDIITIKISESTSAQSKATTKTEKESKTEVTAQPRIPIFKKVMNKIVGEQKINNEFDGEGTTTRSGSLDGTITATVLEVLPNGNLLIEGSRNIAVNKENQIMRVRGVARPKDIDAKNTIDSKLLADAQIKFDGKGTVSRANRHGFMTRIFDSVF